jgi:hypothetical protein
MVDRTTKALLFIVAIGLWVNLAATWFRPVTVHAQGDARIVNGLANLESYLADIESRLASIESQIALGQITVSSLENDVGRIQRGTCTNNTIC